MCLRTLYNCTPVEYGLFWLLKFVSRGRWHTAERAVQNCYHWKKFFFKSYFIQLNNKEIKFGKHSNEQCCDWNLVWNMMIMSFNLNWWVWTFNPYFGSYVCVLVILLTEVFFDNCVYILMLYLFSCVVFIKAGIFIKFLGDFRRVFSL